MPYNVYERRPTYEMLEELPYQGEWSEREYIELESNKLIEFTDGFLEFLPMPTEIHLYVQNFIVQIVRAILARRGNGSVNYAPFKMKVDSKRFREPDVLVLLDSKDPRRGNRYWSGADIVFEIVSPDNPERDYWKKRADYADAGVKEYWIIDPVARKITLLWLENGEYQAIGEFLPGTVVTSKLLPELSIDVSASMAAANQAAVNEEPLQR
jgi:Uma2 family endonuclease